MPQVLADILIMTYCFYVIAISVFAWNKLYTKQGKDNKDMIGLFFTGFGAVFSTLLLIINLFK